MCELVPLRELVTPPEKGHDRALYETMVQAPELAPQMGQDAAAMDALAEFLQDKLDWPITIDPTPAAGLGGEETWYTFSAQGEPLVSSRSKTFPVQALDCVSHESLDAVTRRNAVRIGQLVEMALLDAASTTVIKTLHEQASTIVADEGAHAFDEARSILAVSKNYLTRLEALDKSLDPANQWLRTTIAARREAFGPVSQEVAAAFEAANVYREDASPDKTAGEIYDEQIEDAEESGGVFGWLTKWSLKTWRGIGGIVTGGGQGLTAANARAYRSGKISHDAYKRNQWLNLGRVGVTGLATALTAGEATEPTLALLGLEEGGAGAAVASTFGEGAVGGFVQAFSSDVYAKLAGAFSSDPGVTAFQESTVAGPAAWFEAALEGGVTAHAVGAVGRALEGPPNVQGPSDASAPLEETTSTADVLPDDAEAPPMSVLDESVTSPVIAPTGPVPGTKYVSGDLTGVVLDDGSLSISHASRPDLLFVVRDGSMRAFQAFPDGSMQELSIDADFDLGAEDAPPDVVEVDAGPVAGPILPSADPFALLSEGGTPTRSVRRVQNMRGTGRERGLAANQYMAESYRGQLEGHGTGVQTKLGLRKHDVVEIPGSPGTEMAVESKNYRRFRTVDGTLVVGRVPLTKEIRVQIYKDALWIREGRKLGMNRIVQWEFVGAPPSAALEQMLLEWRLPIVLQVRP